MFTGEPSFQLKQHVKSPWKAGSVFIPFIQAKQIAEWTSALFFNRRLVGVSNSFPRFTQRFRLPLPLESASNGSCKGDSADVTRHSPSSARPYSANHIAFFSSPRRIALARIRAHKRFHSPPLAPHLIMTNENPFSVTKQEPHFISARRAQSCALLLLVSAAGFVGLISLKLVF